MESSSKSQVRRLTLMETNYLHGRKTSYHRDGIQPPADLQIWCSFDLNLWQRFSGNSTHLAEAGIRTTVLCMGTEPLPVTTQKPLPRDGGLQCGNKYSSFYRTTQENTHVIPGLLNCIWKAEKVDKLYITLRISIHQNKVKRPDPAKQDAWSTH